jgi:hypothetical protein
VASGRHGNGLLTELFVLLLVRVNSDQAAESIVQRRAEFDRAAASRPSLSDAFRQAGLFPAENRPRYEFAPYGIVATRGSSGPDLNGLAAARADMGTSDTFMRHGSAHRFHLP